MKTVGYDALLHAIYSVTDDPLQLKPALAMTVAAVGAVAGSFSVFDGNSQSVVMSITCGTPPLADFDYAERYAHLDPRTPAVMAAPLGQWTHCHDVCTPAFVHTSPFYQEFLIPYGLRWSAGTKLFRASAHTGVLGIHSGTEQQPLGSQAMRLLTMLTPHWQRVCELQSGLRAARDQGFVMRQILNELNVATLVCDRGRHVIIASDSALSLLTEGDGLYLHDNELRCSNAETQRHLSGLLQRSAGAAPGVNGEVENGLDRALRVPRSRKESDLLLVVRPMRPAGAPSHAGYDPRFLVAISDPTRDAENQVTAVALFYGLTPAEVSLARCLAKGGDLEAAAESNGVRLPTVKSQLASIFAKTGVHRQAELVALIRGITALRHRP